MMNPVSQQQTPDKRLKIKSLNVYVYMRICIYIYKNNRNLQQDSNHIIMLKDHKILVLFFLMRDLGESCIWLP